jgi:hypothetical protein
MTADDARKVAEIVDVWDSDAFVFEVLVCRLVKAFPEHDWVSLVVDRQRPWARDGVRECLEHRLARWDEE